MNSMSGHYLLKFGKLFEGGKDGVVHTGLRQATTKYGIILVFDRRENGERTTPVMRLVRQAEKSSKGHERYVVTGLPEENRDAVKEMLRKGGIEGPYDFDPARYATPLAEQPETVVN